MTVAPQFSFGVTGQAIDDTSYSVFQGLNAPFGTGLVCGNFFLGLQASIAIAIPMGELLGIARGAHVDEADLSTFKLGLVANGNWTVGGTINIDVLVDDSPRYSSEDGLGEAGPFDSKLAAKSPNGYGPSWRRDFSGIFDVRLEDTGGTPFVDLGLGNSGSFALLPLAGVRAELAQIITVPAGPNWSVARAIMELRRFGAPIGSMEVAIQGSQSDGFGHVEPDGVDLGVSAAVLNSTVVLQPGNGPITYAFTPDVVLTPGTYWAVLRPSVPYVPDFTNFIVWMQRRIFLGPGGSHRTLLGERFDQALYPGHADVFLDTNAKKVAGGPVVWAVPAGVAGSLLVTPSLSSLIEEVVRTSGHETTSAAIFTLTTVGQTRSFRFAGHGHPTRSSPSTSAQFRRRDNRAETI